MHTVQLSLPGVNSSPSLVDRIAAAFAHFRQVEESTNSELLTRAPACARPVLDTVTKEQTTLVDVSTRLEKMTAHRLRNEQIARYLVQQNTRLGSGDNKKLALAEKLRSCFRSVAFAPDGHMNGGDFGTFAVRSCNQYRLCGNCASRRAGRYAQLYLGRVSEILKRYPEASVYTLVFTIPSGDYIYDRFSCLMHGVRTLNKRATVRRTVTEWKNVLAGVGSVEIKRGTGTGLWHPHMHALIIASQPLNEDKIRNEWCRYTGGTNLFLKDHGRMEDEASAGAVCEVLKYNVKLNELAYDDLWAVHNAFSRKRLLSSWGLFRGLELLDEPEVEQPPPSAARWYDWDSKLERYVSSN